MKKTLAVLLDNIMLRLGKLESKVENIYNGTGGNLTNGTSTATPSATNSEKVNVAGMCNIFCRCCVPVVVTGRKAEGICLESGFVHIFDKGRNLVPKDRSSKRKCSKEPSLSRLIPFQGVGLRHCYSQEL